MAYPGTVDYHAAIGGGGKTPVPPLRTALRMKHTARWAESYTLQYWCHAI